MRSDRDKRTDTEREIDEFLSRFDDPADELSADINTYLNEQNTQPSEKSAQTFQWKVVESADSINSFEEKTVKEPPVSGRPASAPETYVGKHTAVLRNEPVNKDSTVSEEVSAEKDSPVSEEVSAEKNSPVSEAQPDSADKPEEP